MTEIVLQVQDGERAKFLLELLQSLKFVEVLTPSSPNKTKHRAKKNSSPVDFFDFAGIWADRDIDIATIRQKAWPKRT